VKSVLKATTGLVASLCAVAFVVALGVGVASVALKDPGPHKFAHLDAPLWTAEPVVVDVATQHYARLPALVASADVPASGLPDAVMTAGRALPSVEAQAEAATVSPDTVQADAEGARTASSGGVAPVDPLQVEWCSARYHSYRADDNSYQPFDGGPRRPCIAPAGTGSLTADAGAAAGMASGQDQVIEQGDIGPAAETVSAPVPQQAASADVPTYESAAGSHDGWCAARYRSWRPDDNTYQPFDGGPRRTCVSPYG
jgi:hypothetical protein